jgi:hypothetical protein
VIILSFVMRSNIMAIPLPHTRWGFDNNVIPGWSESATQARVSLEALRKFSELSPDVRVIYGHEQ